MGIYPMPFYAMSAREYSIAFKGWMLNRAEMWRMVRRVSLFVANAAGAKIMDEKNLFPTFGEQSSDAGAWTEERIRNSVEKLLKHVNNERKP